MAQILHYPVNISCRRSPSAAWLAFAVNEDASFSDMPASPKTAAISDTDLESRPGAKIRYRGALAPGIYSVEFGLISRTYI